MLLTSLGLLQQDEPDGMPERANEKERSGWMVW
jgi:hypothetical protein